MRAPKDRGTLLCVHLEQFSGLSDCFHNPKENYRLRGRKPGLPCAPRTVNYCDIYDVFPCKDSDGLGPSAVRTTKLLSPQQVRVGIPVPQLN